jgi:hypothetical protein
MGDPSNMETNVSEPRDTPSTSASTVTTARHRGKCVNVGGKMGDPSNMETNVSEPRDTPSTSSSTVTTARHRGKCVDVSRELYLKILISPKFISSIESSSLREVQ